MLEILSILDTNELISTETIGPKIWIKAAASG